MDDTVDAPDPTPTVPSLTNGGTEKAADFPKTQAKNNIASVGRVLSNVDATALRLSRHGLISTSYSEEAVFATVGYSADILHHALFSPPIRTILSRLRSRLGFSSLNAQPNNSPDAPTPSLLALAALMSETRTALRLLGLIPLWEWGSATVKSPPADGVLRGVAFAQVFVNIVYQFMENVAFLASKGVIPQRIIQRWGGIGKWYIWSTRAWLGHVVLELVRLWRERSLAQRKQAAQAGTAVGVLDAKEQSVEASRRRAWKKSLINNLAWFPLCVHWSLENGAGVPDGIIGVLSMAATAWKISDLWKATSTLT
ncbi:hypothetical protein LOZ65_002186 [Ophidiomyces ophidiicola]|nr:hypothetical protein LOZ65_002186 [Ophidiomyces ophidiicola]